MGGGKGGKGGSSAEIPKELIDISSRLASLSEQTFEIARPGLEVGAGTLQEVLRTGGANALIPAVQQSVEQTRSATSQALRGTQEDLARMGVTGGEAARILAEQRQAGDVAAAQIGPNFALPLVGEAAAQSMGATLAGLQGLGNAAGAMASGTRVTGGGGKGAFEQALFGTLGNRVGGLKFS